MPDLNRNGCCPVPGMSQSGNYHKSRSLSTAACAGLFITALLLLAVLCPPGAAAQATASPDQYRIGPEDVLNIHVWREEALSRTVPVRLDGKISMPLLDDIQAAGTTPLELKDIITDRLREYIDDPIVTVIVTEHNNFKVFVSGQVRTPGVYRLRSRGTLLQIIPMSGGFTDWANQKKILLIRNHNGREERSTINYTKLLDTGSDVELRPGDVIVVP